MMKAVKYLSLISFLLFCFSPEVIAQNSVNTVNLKQRKNILKYNLTPSLFGFESYIVGYERVIKPFQSFSINVGFLALRKDGTSTNEDYEIIRSANSKGVSIVADYRFYLQKENKFTAPHGVYVGPYFASYSTRSGNTIRSLDSSAGNPEIDIDANLNIQNLGIQVGYQFVIKNRLAVDLIVVGPSVSNYKFKLTTTGDVNLSEPEIDEAIEALGNILFEKYPWAKILFDEEGIDFRENKSRWGFGFRYVLQVGFQFLN